MRSLTRLTKSENCFYTVNNVTLRNLQDLLEFLMNCDQDQFSHHVSSGKNDFASWVENVLVFPALAETLGKSKTINEMTDAIMEFFQDFDYRSVNIPEEKHFFTIDDCKLKNVHELYYYLNNCSQESFWHHANNERNDFAKWIDEVLSYPKLASKVLLTKDQGEMLRVVKDFLVNRPGSSNEEEHLRYMAEHKISDSNKNVSAAAQSAKTDEITNNIKNSSVEKNTDRINMDQKNDKVVIKNPNDEEKISFDRKVGVRPEEEEKQPPIGQILDKNGFRQFSDEELEHFVQFIRKDTPDNTDVKVEYLHSCLQELKNMIGELWKVEKDPLIPGLMLRAIGPKIEYYALSKNPEDYNLIIREMRDLQKEIIECDEQVHTNLAEELFKDMKLQGIAMKKA